jgi:predicted short-subunit dehydrogenase-like oxidoreductase (DUF2520 family)
MTKTVTSTTKTSQDASHSQDRLVSASLSILGAGKLGKCLGRLWAQNTSLQLSQVVNRSQESAEQACEFIGAGEAISSDSGTALKQADVWLIATPDAAIETSLEYLVTALGSPEALRGSIVFHCSGALSAKVLARAQQLGAHTASIHPVHSFADPARSLTQFAGSTCTFEGDSNALDTLLPAFTHIGAKLLAVDPEQKLLYHAGSVFACNYLVPLIEASLECFLKAGISKSDAANLLAPLMTGTLNNVLDAQHLEGPNNYLTGPIARGDSLTVSAQLAAITKSLPDYENLYKELGKAALITANKQNGTNPEAIAALQHILNQD